MMRRRLLTITALIIILVMGFMLRIVGINWDNHAYLHPDERFLTTISSQIGKPDFLTPDAKENCPDPENYWDFFDASCSVYNPNNINQGSYAYGTLPVFIVRAVASVFEQANIGFLDFAEDWHSFNYIHLVGRTVNAISDMISIFLIFVIGTRLLSANHGLIAATFYTFAVLPIQLSHFWTVDIQANTFFLIGLLAIIELTKRESFLPYIIFGLAMAAAFASRINIAPMAGLLPLALIMQWHERYLSGKFQNESLRHWLITVGLLSLATISLALVAFRVFQPYAFTGPAFSDLELNEKWVEDISSVSKLSSTPSENWPPSIQWFDRISYVYPWMNLVLWGLGFMLGSLATVSLVFAVLNQIRTRRFSATVGVISVWVIAYFLIMGRLHQMTMRYYLPIYGPLCILAVWGLFQLPSIWRNRAIAISLVMTGLWAFAFTSIYLQPITRIEASQWIVNKIPGTITLLTEDDDLLSLSFPRDRFSFMIQTAINESINLSEPFTVEAEQQFDGFTFDFVNVNDVMLTVQLIEEGENDRRTVFQFDLETDETGHSRFDVSEFESFPGIPPGQYLWQLILSWQSDTEFAQYNMTSFWTGVEDEALNHKFLSPYADYSYVPLNELGLDTWLTSTRDMEVTELIIPHVVGNIDSLLLYIDAQEVSAEVIETSNDQHPLGAMYRFALDQPLTVEIYEEYHVEIVSEEPVLITGSVIATEGAWDDAIPSRHCVYDELAEQYLFFANLFEDCISVDPYGQGYYVNLPINMAEVDSNQKWMRAQDILKKADYLILSSNRFYDALPRVPARFGDSKTYYEFLFGQELGYELIQSFVRMPQLLGIQLPDQFLPTSGIATPLNEWEAEEAFTVYDHPAVFIFKNQDLDPTLLTTFITSDEEEIAELNDDAPTRIALDELPAPTFKLPQTHSSDVEMMTTLILWSVGFVALGWLTLPLMYALFPTLPLYGFAFGRSIAWIILPFVAWWLTSVTSISLMWTQFFLWLVVLVFVGINLAIGWRNRHEIQSFIRSNWQYLVIAELAFLVMFSFGLSLRMVNPDLWHISLGGEKPMDFAYFNSVLRTSSFPPPNPWFAGHSINYYYFGFVVAAFPTKLGNFIPAITTNLTLATIFALVSVNMGTLIFTLIQSAGKALKIVLTSLGVVFIMLAGNLGTISQIILNDSTMATHRWYWYPTRIIGEAANANGGVINEFPSFSFLFGDLHAHIVALLPVTAFLVILVTIVQRRRLWLGALLGIVAAIIYMTNIWDVLLYVPVGLAGMWLATRSPNSFLRLAIYVGLGGVLAALPYILQNSIGANSGIAIWDGERSLIEPFLLVWGIFVAITAMLLIVRLKQVYFSFTTHPVEIGVLGASIVLLLILPADSSTAGLSLIMIIGNMFLITSDDRDFRPLYTAIVIFYAILLALEFIVIQGDVGRMNTVFKLSFQLWLGSGVIIVLIIKAFIHWQHRASTILSAGFILIGLLYPLNAIPARYHDNETGALTLDGNRFMSQMIIEREQGTFIVSKDTKLIDFINENISGFPVIAEWYEREYDWNSRISVQTGLPSVIGWQNHMKQQYPDLHDEIERRIADIQTLFTTTDAIVIEDIIDLYNIKYIIIGELELAFANPETLTLLETMANDGQLHEIFSFETTRLYEVTD